MDFLQEDLRTLRDKEGLGEEARGFLEWLMVEMRKLGRRRYGSVEEY